MKPNGGAAFPGFGQTFTTDAQGRTGPQALWGMEGAHGMTLRDYFAARAIPVAMRQAESASNMDQDVRGNTARIAYEVADAMLAAREKA